MSLHWAIAALEALVPEEILANIQSAQVDPHTPMKADEILPFVHGRTGEQTGAAPTPRVYRLCRSRFRSLLCSGLDVQESKAIADVAYSKDGKTVTATFADGTRTLGRFSSEQIVLTPLSAAF